MSNYFCLLRTDLERILFYIYKKCRNNHQNKHSNSPRCKKYNCIQYFIRKIDLKHIFSISIPLSLLLEATRWISHSVRHGYSIVMTSQFGVLKHSLKQPMGTPSDIGMLHDGWVFSEYYFADKIFRVKTAYTSSQSHKRLNLPLLVWKCPFLGQKRTVCITFVRRCVEIVLSTFGSRIGRAGCASVAAVWTSIGRVREGPHRCYELQALGGN